MSEYSPEQPDDGDDQGQQEADVPQAPEPVEPAPVEVSPADQSDVKTDNIHGKDYEVTPDRGYRVSQ